jgi:hypothetical protein
MAMKSFREYLAESTREYGYVLKLSAEPSDEQLDAAERYLSQFGLVEMTHPVLLADDKLDFVDQPNEMVWQVNFVTTMPLSSYITMEGLREVLNVPEKNIVVRTAVEPVEIHVDDAMTNRGFGKIARDDSLTPMGRISTDRFYQDIEQPIVTDIYGDAYNKRFLDYLAGVKATRPSDEVDSSQPLFSWLEMNKVAPREPVQDMADFNAGYDTPKPVYKPSSNNVADPTPRSGLGPEGNFDDGAMINYRFYKDRDGKRVNLGAPKAPDKAEFVRKG